MAILTTLQELEAIYASPAEASIVKQVYPSLSEIDRSFPVRSIGDRRAGKLGLFAEGRFTGFCPSS
jgi:hypothetical protein